MPANKKKAAAEASKKAAQKKKQQVIEDKTFGLKNKNKSKKVQQQIKSIEKNVMNSGDPRQRKLDEMRKQQKAEAKARKKAMEDERNALFGEALMAVQKKNKKTNQKDGKVEAKGRDHEDDDKKKGTSRAMKMMYQMDAQEMSDRLREDPNYVPTLEDEIEAQRQAKVAQLKKSGKPGTPITEETFRAWKERKRQERAEASKKLVEAELKKKKGGKGLAVLSGRDLYEYKKELFVEQDDDGDNQVMDMHDIPEEADDGENGGDTQQSDKKMPAAAVDQVAGKVQSDLFLEGEDDDLDDIDDD